jgi:O-antigen/teichoic acid export membrane protein
VSEPPSASEAAGRRVAANTIFRAIGELSGKLGTFVLFAVLARVLGQEEVGTYVVAFAYVQVVTVLIDLGFDRVTVRHVAVDATKVPALFTDIVAIKLTIAVPVTAASWALAHAIGYAQETIDAIYVLSAALLLDSLNRTATSILNAREHGGLVSVSIIAQRVSGAALGVAVLLAGYGVVAVCVAYGVGAAFGLAVAIRLMVRHVARPAPKVTIARWRALLRESIPFALNDSLAFVLSKVDAIVLSVLATQAAVGLYGAASRLYEASWFVTFSLTASFQAMFAYLTPTSEPSIGGVFERSIKLALTVLAPITALFIVEAGPLAALLFGEDFRGSSAALELLAPTVVLMGVVSLSTTLLAIRVGARLLLWITGGIVALNVGLTIALVESMGARGAALAMSISVGVFAVIVVTVAARAVGGIDLLRMTAAPAVAALTMGLVMAAVASPVMSVVAGGVAYLAVFAAAERLVAPDDLRYLVTFLRRRRDYPAVT